MTAAAIVGLGLTEMGKVYGRSSAQLAAHALAGAVEDAGLRPADLDGLLLSNGATGGLDLDLAVACGLGELRLLAQVQSFGATAGAMVQHAALAIEHGMATAVACVFADAPLQPARSAGGAYGGRPGQVGFAGIAAASGFAGANPYYAL